MQVFSRFGNIREIMIFSWTIPELDQDLKIDAARAIAAQCRCLERFYFKDGDGNPMVMTFVPDHEGINSFILSNVGE
jgi:hypothetical protein